MTRKFIQTIRSIMQSFRLMVGLPDYTAYVKHMKSTHPDRPIMPYEVFFWERQNARYSGNGKVSRCC